MRFFLPILPLMRGWAISFVVYGVLALVLIGQFALAVSMPFSDAARMAVRDWLPWALLTPLLFRFVARCPLGPGRWTKAVPIHLLCGLVVFVIVTVWAERIFPPQRPERPHVHERERAHEGPPPPRPGGDGLGGALMFAVGFRFPIYLAIISLAHAVYFFRGSQEREKRTLGLEASLAKARLEALRMQLQPHFLFNSLNAIAELVHKNPDAADEMLVALSRLLRMALDTSGEQEWPLSSELEFLERYLAIEQVRLGERLDVVVEVDESVRSALVPIFLLQPIVENSIRHGLEPKLDRGVLKVQIRKRGADLFCMIADNGVGLPVGQALREGVGLSNTKARLLELYGESSRFNIRGLDGAIVEISLPFKAS